MNLANQEFLNVIYTKTIAIKNITGYIISLILNFWRQFSMVKLITILCFIFFSTANYAFSSSQHGPSEVLSILSIYDESLLEGDTVRVKGKAGFYNADYLLTKTGDTIRIQGKIGKYNANYRITKNGNTLFVEGNVGKYNANYSIHKTPESITVQGRIGQYNANYNITKQ